MANILLVDPEEVAHRAMRGIVSQGAHRMVAVESVAEAWELLRGEIAVDMVVTELKLKGGDSGLDLIQKMKGDPFLRWVPIVVYTGHADKNSVRQVLNLRVQDFLLKPYRDESVFAEIGKATADFWWKRMFGEPKAELTDERRKSMLEALRQALARAEVSFYTHSRGGEVNTKIVEATHKLRVLAANVGARGVASCLRDFEQRASEGTWPDGKNSLEPLGFAARLIERYLNPDHCPEAFMSEEERNCEIEATERRFWSQAYAEDRCPMVGMEQLEREMDNLPSCPVVDSIAASYEMAATGRPTSLAPLIDLVQKDPSLTVQMLIEANRLKRGKDDANASMIEESRMAVGLLGELRLASVGSGFSVLEERFVEVSPQFTWPQFRMFQLATARLAEFVCDALEIHGLRSVAYTAGLIHDIGKLILMRLHPFALPAILGYAREVGTRLSTAEKYFLGTTTHEMAAYFGEKFGLPQRFVSVLRWMDNPAGAPVDAELVAVVSLARDICRHNHVGFNGDTPLDDSVPLAETPEWKVLQSKVYLNFDLHKFEVQAHRECQTLKRELLCKVTKRVAVA